MSRESVPEPLGPRPGPREQEHAIEPVPEHVRQAARRAFAARDRQAQVLALVTDSLVDGADDRGPRRLAFAGAGAPGQVDVTVLDHTDAPQITLVIECPWRDGRVEQVECAEQRVPVAEQAPGRWVAGPVPHGLFRAALRRGDENLTTAWVRV